MKRMRFWLVAIAITAALAAVGSQAQTGAPPQAGAGSVMTRAFEIKSAEPYTIKSTLDPIAKANGVIITIDPRNKVLILAGAPDRINEMEALIRRLDVSPPLAKSIEITGYLLSAGDSSLPNSTEGIPAAIEPALKQLRATFNYKSYQLLDVTFLRNRIGGEGGTQGSFPLPDFVDPQTGTSSSRSSGYRFSYGNSYLTRDDKGDVIHLDSMALAIDAGGSIRTNLDMRPGQLLVVGKTNLERVNKALFAIITAKILD